MGLHYAASSSCCTLLIAWTLVTFFRCTQSVHLYRSRRHNDTSNESRYAGGHYSILDSAMASKQEVKDYLGWVERVRAKYEQDWGAAGAQGGFQVPAAAAGRTSSYSDGLMEEGGGAEDDKVYSTLKMRVEKVITVNQVAGLGDFQSVQAAIDSVPKNNVQRTVIQIAAGVYKEKVKIPKTKGFLTIVGAGMNSTTITWNDTAKSSTTTFKSATFAVMAPGFVARNIAFENTAPSPQPGAEGAQAVAFQISGDHSALYSCAFLGAQDTLYDHKGRHFFKDCWIQGSIDFIFGDGSLTAQKRKSATEDTGFSFLNCSITGRGVVLLGRAWGAYSRVVFLHSHIDTTIMPGGWNDWGIPSREKTSFYGEYKCWGRGASVHNRVAWAHQLTDSQAGPFMSTSFIDGQSWIASIS
ncbi:hypothetical protein L7F22_006402 [Adiantum nelumboides]|nr:hypothetical protein [Adiantum nelumboides]